MTEVELAIWYFIVNLPCLMTILLPGLLLKLIFYVFVLFLCLNLKLVLLTCTAFDFSLPSLEKFDPGICTLKYVGNRRFLYVCSGQFSKGIPRLIMQIGLEKKYRLGEDTFWASFLSFPSINWLLCSNYNYFP